MGVMGKIPHPFVAGQRSSLNFHELDQIFLWNSGEFGSSQFCIVISGQLCFFVELYDVLSAFHGAAPHQHFCYVYVLKYYIYIYIYYTLYVQYKNINYTYTILYAYTNTIL